MGSKFVFILAVVLFHRDLLCYSTNTTDNVTLLYIYPNEEKMSPTILDCEFDIERNPKPRIVKWIKDNRLVCQWIYGFSSNSTPEFKDDIECFFKSSTDRNTWYSSLSLSFINPTIKTTGDYTCRVFYTSDYFESQQRVQVFDLSNYSLDLSHKKIPNGTQLECILTDMYPKPTLKILSDTGEVIKEESNAQENEDGYFNATAVVDVNENITKSYGCQVFFEEGFQINLYSL